MSGLDLAAPPAPVAVPAQRGRQRVASLTGIEVRHVDIEVACLLIPGQR